MATWAIADRFCNTSQHTDSTVCQSFQTFLSRSFRHNHFLISRQFLHLTIEHPPIELVNVSLIDNQETQEASLFLDYGLSTRTWTTHGETQVTSSIKKKWLTSERNVAPCVVHVLVESPACNKSSDEADDGIQWQQCASTPPAPRHDIERLSCALPQSIPDTFSLWKPETKLTFNCKLPHVSIYEFQSLRKPF